MNKKKVWYVVIGILIIGQFILNNNLKRGQQVIVSGELHNNLKSQNKEFQKEVEFLKETNSNQKEYIDYIYANVLTPLGVNYKGDEIPEEFLSLYESYVNQT